MLVTALIAALAVGQQDWYVFEPDSRAFRVALPSKPNRTGGRTVTRASGRSQVTTAQLRTSQATYSIVVTESPARVSPDTLDDGIRQFAAGKNAALGTLETITVDGNAGREFESTEGPSRSKHRWVTSGNSLYILMVEARPGGAVPANAQRFLDSLEIGPSKAGANPVVVARAAESTPPRTAAKEKEKAAEADEPPAKEEVEVDDGTAKPAAGKAASRKSAPMKVTFTRIPKTAKPYPLDDLENLGRSYERDRDSFRDIGPAGSVLVGVRVTYIERFGGPKVRSVQPIYRSNKNHYLGRIYGEVVGPVYTFVARPGYAVGGLVTHTGLTVDGFGMVFMKVNEDTLDIGDQYKSPWIGDEKGGSPGEVNAKTGLVVGLQGRAGSEVFALGLTAIK